jgi:hypothetical protein
MPSGPWYFSCCARSVGVVGGEQLFVSDQCDSTPPFLEQQ